MFTGCQFFGIAGSLPNLAALLRELVAQVPPGRVTTYGLLADALGDRAAARWVGELLAHHEAFLPNSGWDFVNLATACPCHRVVRADGSLGLYAHGDPTVKEELLRREAIDIHNGRVDLDRHSFRPLSPEPQPLRRLKELQEEVARAVRLKPPGRTIRRVGAVDVAYCGEEAFGVYVLMDPKGEKILWELTLSRKTEFPYISGFLAFRELPLLCALMEAAASAGQLADAILVDGSGIVHPRGVGVASHLGVIWGRPTIGVTKTLLCGTLESVPAHPWVTHWIKRNNETVGFAFRPSSQGKELLYVSPGHLIDLHTCEEIINPLRRGHRLPEPLYWADRRSKELSRATRSA